MRLRRTKIVCTLGPATSDYTAILALVREGMDVARLNFSHGDYQEHGQRIQLLRKASEETGRPVAIMQDLSGPKIRIGDLPEGGIHLQHDQIFRLSTEPVQGDNQQVSVNYKGLTGDVKVGDRILVADGNLELSVLEVSSTAVDCKVVIGGPLTSRKGVSVPSATLQIETFTEKDKRDLAFGLEQGVDIVALSFVREADDILKVRQAMHEFGKVLPIIAKIEQHEVLDVIDDVIAVSDAIMVARGDLGVEIAIEKVPQVQKQLIYKANRAGKNVITATQMLRSMTENPRPTRAEVTDVANAILDGSDAVMLSEETAVGEYAVQAVRMMNSVALETETSSNFASFRDKSISGGDKLLPADAVSAYSIRIAEAIGAAVIVVPTLSGTTARLVARHRPHQPILSLTPDPATQHLLCLCWGVVTELVPAFETADDLMAAAKKAAVTTGLARPGDHAVITAGLPPFVRGVTNMIKVERLDD